MGWDMSVMSDLVGLSTDGTMQRFTLSTAAATQADGLGLATHDVLLAANDPDSAHERVSLGASRRVHVRGEITTVVDLDQDLVVDVHPTVWVSVYPGVAAATETASDEATSDQAALEPTPVAQVPLGAPGPWTVFGHYLGGDDILIQAAPDTAATFMRDALGFDLDDLCECDFGCGPIWDTRCGPNDDGSFPARPMSVQEVTGARWDGSPRTSVYVAGTVAAAVGA